MHKVYLGPALGLIGARAVIVTFYFKLIRALLAFCGAEYSICICVKVGLSLDCMLSQ